VEGAEDYRQRYANSIAFADPRTPKDPER